MSEMFTCPECGACCELLKGKPKSGNDWYAKAYPTPVASAKCPVCHEAYCGNGKELCIVCESNSPKKLDSSEVKA